MNSAFWIFIFGAKIEFWMTFETLWKYTDPSLLWYQNTSEYRLEYQSPWIMLHHCYCTTRYLWSQVKMIFWDKSLDRNRGARLEPKKLAVSIIIFQNLFQKAVFQNDTCEYCFSIVLLTIYQHVFQCTFCTTASGQLYPIHSYTSFHSYPPLLYLHSNSLLYRVSQQC